MKQIKNNRTTFAFFLFYFSEAIIVTITLAIEFRDVIPHLNIPMCFFGDALHHLTIIKAIIQNGWWWHISKLSAPFGFNFLMFPVGGTFDSIIYKILSLFTNQPGLIFNLFFFITVILTALLATWSMIHLKIPKNIAFLLGILFSLIPEIYYRGMLQIWANMYLIPVVATFAVIYGLTLYCNKNFMD